MKDKNKPRVADIQMTSSANVEENLEKKVDREKFFQHFSSIAAGTTNSIFYFFVIPTFLIGIRCFRKN